MSRYYAMWDEPRPESGTIDKETASNLSTDIEKKLLYREIASAAESGWDFSTRWMKKPDDLTTLTTTSILPVDLNTYILKMELDLAFFADIIGDDNNKTLFLSAAKSRQEAIDAFLWNNKKNQWFDYWVPDGSSYQRDTRGLKWEEKNQNENIFASNFIPLWIKPFYSDGPKVSRVLKSLCHSSLLQPFGIATSLTKSQQQWDFPNGWAPLQHMIVEGLSHSGIEEAECLAKDIAMKWVRANYVAYKKTGVMHEKLNVTACGDIGRGGEYHPQTGFGWTNGVVLAFLEEFGWPSDMDIDCK